MKEVIMTLAMFMLGAYGVAIVLVTFYMVYFILANK